MTGCAPICELVGAWAYFTSNFYNLTGLVLAVATALVGIYLFFRKRRRARLANSRFRKLLASHLVIFLNTLRGCYCDGPTELDLKSLARDPDLLRLGRMEAGSDEARAALRSWVRDRSAKIAVYRLPEAVMRLVRGLKECEDLILDETDVSERELVQAGARLASDANLERGIDVRALIGQYVDGPNSVAAPRFFMGEYEVTFNQALQEAQNALRDRFLDERAVNMAMGGLIEALVELVPPGVRVSRFLASLGMNHATEY